MGSIRRVEWPAALVVLVAMLWSAAVSAQPGVGFPHVLHGTWESTLPCDTGETADRDDRFEISASQRLGYEEIEDLVSVEPLADKPLTWRVVTLSNVGPVGLEQAFIYVLDGDSLGVTDAHSAAAYRRCR